MSRLLDIDTGLKARDVQKDIWEQMRRNGLVPPRTLHLDGEIHRFRANPDKRSDNNSGWYVFFRDQGFIAGAYGDWSLDVDYKLRSGMGQMDAVQTAALESRIKEAQEKAKADREQRQERAAQECRQKWASLDEAELQHPYIQRKRLRGVYGARVDKSGNLVIPLMDEKGNIMSLEAISFDGSKRFYPNGRKQGCMWQIGEGKPSFMAEGYATAASIYEATGKACVIAFDAGNLVHVAPFFPDVTIVADNDRSGTGEKKAKESGLPYILIPEVGMDANDYATSGKNLGALLCPSEPPFRLMDGNQVKTVPPPRAWLVKNWILRGENLEMLYGQSGSGKTFVVTDMMLRIAAGMTDWCGCTVHRGKVLYLCGEGYFETLERIRVWVQENGNPDLSGTFMMSDDALLLDTPEGYDALVRTLQHYNYSPDLIVLDTLNRFMAGDENDTRDAGTFIRACAQLQRRYNCTVLLIHHTGLTDIERARGSSAFLGALDMQVRVTRNREYIVVEQTKNKGGKLQEKKTFVLEDHDLAGESDEDGEAIHSALVRPTDNVQPGADDNPKLLRLKDELVKYFVRCGINENDRIARLPRKALVDAVRDEIRLELDEQERTATQRQIDQLAAKRIERFVERVKENGLVSVAKDEYGNTVYETEGFIHRSLNEPFWSMNIGVLTTVDILLTDNTCQQGSSC